MINAIVLTYDVFAMESRVCIVKNGEETYQYVPSNVSEVSAMLTQLAYENEIYNVVAQAPDRFAQEIRNTIAENERKLYSANKIKVEVI